LLVTGCQQADCQPKDFDFMAPTLPSFLQMPAAGLLTLPLRAVAVNYGFGFELNCEALRIHFLPQNSYRDNAIDVVGAICHTAVVKDGFVIFQNVQQAFLCSRFSWKQ